MNKELEFLRDSLKGEINRMFVTDDLDELDEMYLYAIRNIIKIRRMREDELFNKEVI